MKLFLQVDDAGAGASASLASASVVAVARALHLVLAQALGQVVDLFFGIADQRLGETLADVAGSVAITSILMMPSVGS